MNELQSKEIYDSAGNVNPEVLDKFELAGEIYELVLKTISEAPKKIAEAMGHSLDTHLLSYARFNTKDLAK